MVEQYVVDLRKVDRTQTALVGGKGANLGELSRIDGIHVPPGFCITTEAFRRATAPIKLATPHPEDRESIAEARRTIEALTLPADLAAQIAAALDDGTAYAVRSSATAEDLPAASFAGQQDTYLNAIGQDHIFQYVIKCWASLYTDRAVAYRLRNGIDHDKLAMAVVVQRMVDPDAAGVLFTADPITGNRKVATVDAVPGLGEALVSGLVNPDAYRIRDGKILSRTLAAARPALTDEHLLRLVEHGRRIEAHFGSPQDIEWCLAGGGFQFVQARPITTLFPVPEATGRGNHVYLSVGHQQMMTDAMKPLGISVWQQTAMAPMRDAGGRLFVDATPRLTTPAGRAALLDLIGRGDPLFRDALETALAGDFIPLLPDPAPGPTPARTPIATDPAIVTQLIERGRTTTETLRRDVQGKTGPELIDFLRQAFQDHKKVLTDPLSIQAIMAGMEATWWLNDHLDEWLGEKNAADTLTLSVPGNITSEMGLALLDVADVLRPYPEVIAYLRDGSDLDGLRGLHGGTEALDAVQGYLDRYGMRCAGEIDITRPRWSENPATLFPLILDNIKLFTPGAAARRFEQGLQSAKGFEEAILDRLRALPGGEEKATETKQMIDRVRTFIGYREYPKYTIISRYFIYKQALLAEADRLVRSGTLQTREDLFYVNFQELPDLVRTKAPATALVRTRRAAFRTYQALTAPRVLTSDGEVIAGSYHRDDVPPGALAGLPVSAGTVEGRARVILDMAEADLEAGDILVTAYTDPSWSPLFVAITGLVTEVGGLMTHGAVIAREYGLPAVVGVQGATQLIPDGRRIRVHGTAGYIELLD